MILETPQRPPEETARSRALVPAVIVVLNAVIFAPVYLGRNFLYYRDVLLNYVPNRRWLVERLLSGEIPLWNDRILGGLPFWADPVQAVMYPGNAIFLLTVRFHPVHAYGIFVGLHYLVAHLGYFRLLSRLSVNDDGRYPRLFPLAVSAALTYGGIALELSWGLQFLCAFAWIGWAGAAVMDLVENPCRRTSVRLALWVALLVTTGDIQTVYVFGLVALVLARPWELRSGDGRVRLSLCCLSFVAGAGLAAAVLLPAVVFGFESDRLLSNTEAASQVWSWHPARILDWFAPGLFSAGGDVQVNYRDFARPVNFENQPFYFTNGAPGILAVVCLVPGIFLVRRDPVTLRALIGAVICLLVACGENLPVWHFLRTAMPGWSGFRYPERMLVPLSISLAIVSVRVLGHWANVAVRGCEPGVFGKVIRKWAPSLAYVLAAPAIITGVCGALLGWFGVTTQPAMIAHAQKQFQIALCVAVLLAVFVRILGKYRTAALAAMSLALSLEIWFLNRQALRTADRSLFPEKPELVEALERRLPEGSPVPPLVISREVKGLQTGREAYSPSAQYWSVARQNLAMLYSFATPDGYGSAEPLRRYLARRELRLVEMMQLQGVEYAVLKNGESPGNAWNCADPVESTGMWICSTEGSGAVRAPRRWLVAPGLDELRSVLKSPVWSPGAFEIIGDLKEGVPAQVPTGESEPALLQVHRWTPEVRAVRVERQTPGPVILRDNFDSGWNAYLDGQRVDTFTANGFQLAAWTPAGNMELEFRYEPWSVDVGLIITCLSALLMLLGARMQVSEGSLAPN